MIAPDSHAAASQRAASGSEPAAATFPPHATLRNHPLPTGETLELALVPADESREPTPPLPGAAGGGAATVARDWVIAAAASLPPAMPATLAPTVVPLYGCVVIWTPARAAVVGPPDRLEQLEAELVAFASCEARLREAESRSLALLEAAEADTGADLDLDTAAIDRRTDLARRYREAVALGRRLALVAPAVHTPPLHPPTLASQLGERLRDRTRLAERHALAVERAELAERVTETVSQRAVDLGIARRQTALEWAIVVLLVVQTALLLVDLLSRSGGS